MAWNEEAQLDPDNLYLEGKAADDVGKLFGTLKTELDTLRQGLDTYQPDLGMKGCEEGATWNAKAKEAAQKIYDKIGTFMVSADTFAARAKATQTAYEDTEARNGKHIADQYPKVDTSTAWPPPHDK